MGRLCKTVEGIAGDLGQNTAKQVGKKRVPTGANSAGILQNVNRLRSGVVILGHGCEFAVDFEGVKSVIGDEKNEEMKRDDGKPNMFVRILLALGFLALALFLERTESILIVVCIYAAIFCLIPYK